MGRNEQCVIVLRSVLLFIHREATFTNAGGGGMKSRCVRILQFLNHSYHAKTCILHLLTKELQNTGCPKKTKTIEITYC
jgi:hypothetical protein